MSKTRILCSSCLTRERFTLGEREIDPKSGPGFADCDECGECIDGGRVGKAYLVVELEEAV